MPRALALGATLVLLWSGSGTALGPADPPAAARVLTVVSGETGEAVVGASVAVGGRSYSTDDRGEVVLEASAMGDLEITAEGYLGRRTRLPRSGRVPLWPTGPTYSGQ